ncbi:transcription initiation factor TFIID 23-30kDa subunit-domain-containing protein [Naematelia encephala]|uniref:Transcription initiation factor TFIID subunit 10 n=1 Tax=Naematelia encephala TaxID=71784 RepID=A0A1Y2AQI1_9TREE|nr:transcription initiation factor TFIID 23-30kDa subunit-domain-containing protein [Naematelia encephala]
MSDPSSTLAGSSPAAPTSNSASTVANGNSAARPNGDAGPSTPALPPGTGQEDIKPAVDPTVDMIQVFAQRREEELARRDRSLAEFLVMLDGYKPLIPEEVTEYYLQRSGFECSDPRLKRLLSLSAQKFVSDLARDAYHFAKLRVNGTTAGRGRPAAGADRNKVVLTMDDLSLALGEHGVNAKKPDYYL